MASLGLNELRIKDPLKITLLSTTCPIVTKHYVMWEGVSLLQTFITAGAKLDKSTACRQLKSPRSLSGRSIHLTLVTKWSWSWSWMTYCHPFVQCQSALPFWDTAISKFDHENPWSKSCVCGQRSRSRLTFKFKGQGYGQGQTRWSHLSTRVQSICLLLVS